MEYIVTILVILLVLFALCLYALYNILTKYEEIEDELDKTDDLIISLYKDLDSAYGKINKLDRLGSFEADDETGYVFEQIKRSIDNINKKYNIDGTQEKG
tara:strand:+ start:270 stop:569 length:300 start_codon:yes stop_codon:yes gene_type:complete